nr:BRO family protein [Bacillus thuringiensis]
MNQLQVFNNKEFGQVRTVVQDENVWFVAKDVSDILGFSEASAMTRTLDMDEKGLQDIRLFKGCKNYQLSTNQDCIHQSYDHVNHKRKHLKSG